MRDQVLAAAGGAGRAADLHGDTIEQERRTEKPRAVEVERGLGQILVNGGVGEKCREIVDRFTAAVKGQFPVERRR